MKKKSLKGIIGIFVVVLIVFIGSTIIQSNRRAVIIDDPVPDILGSDSLVNQEIKKGDDWQQIVSDSKFQLGELYVVGGELEYQHYGTFPKLDGSTVALAMAHEFAWQHLGMSEEESRLFIQFSTTHRAYMGLMGEEIYAYHRIQTSDGKTIRMEEGKIADLIIATYPSEDELRYASEQGIELRIEPICYDAFVFITHIDNPVESLTIEQVQKIYTGEITNWKEVGGNDEAIVAYQREAGSGSQSGMELLVMQGLKMAEPEAVKIVMGMGWLIESVAEYQNESYSIGYTYRYYIDNLYKNPDIKILAIEGVSPNDENIRNASYSFTTSYYAVIDIENQEGIAGEFLAWILSDEGQKCIEQAGYIPLR